MKRILLTSALVLLCAPSLLLAANAPTAADQQYVSGNPAAAPAPATATATATTTQQGPAINIPSQDFLNQVGEIMVTKSCDPQSPLLSNFKLTPQECQAKVSSAEKLCAPQIVKQMPATITSTDLAAKWGQSYGECVGKYFAASLQPAPGSAAVTAPVVPAGSAPAQPAQ